MGSFLLRWIPLLLFSESVNFVKIVSNCGVEPNRVMLTSSFSAGSKHWNGGQNGIF